MHSRRTQEAGKQRADAEAARKALAKSEVRCQSQQNGEARLTAEAKQAKAAAREASAAAAEAAEVAQTAAEELAKVRASTRAMMLRSEQDVAEARADAED